jgi:hypothetical protein
MQKGQLGVFMIIGVVLLLLVSFWLYVQNYAVKRQGELQLRESQNFESDIKALQVYLSSVADASAEKALVVWTNSSGVFNTSASGLPFEECDFSGRKQNLTYFYKDGTNYFDADGDDEPEKSRLRQNLSAMTSSLFISAIKPEVFDEKGMMIENRSLAQTNVSVEFNNFGTTVFTFTPVLVALKGGIQARFSDFSIEKNVSVKLIEDELPLTISWATSNGDFGAYNPQNPQKIEVCGSDGQDSCVKVGGLDDTAYMISISLDESFGGSDKFRFDFLVDVPVQGCSV